jgi:hypothetical protein
VELPASERHDGHPGRHRRCRRHRLRRRGAGRSGRCRRPGRRGGAAAPAPDGQRPGRHRRLSVG